eukprot:Pgem_evm1s4908
MQLHSIDYLKAFIFEKLLGTYSTTKRAMNIKEDKELYRQWQSIYTDVGGSNEDFEEILLLQYQYDQFTKYMLSTKAEQNNIRDNIKKCMSKDLSDSTSEQYTYYMSVKNSNEAKEILQKLKYFYDKLKETLKPGVCNNVCAKRASLMLLINAYPFTFWKVIYVYISENILKNVQNDTKKEEIRGIILQRLEKYIIYQAFANNRSRLINETIKKRDWPIAIVPDFISDAVYFIKSLKEYIRQIKKNNIEVPVFLQDETEHTLKGGMNTDQFLYETMNGQLYSKVIKECSLNNRTKYIMLALEMQRRKVGNPIKKSELSKIQI